MTLLRVSIENNILKLYWDIGKTTSYDLENHVAIGISGKEIKSLNHVSYQLLTSEILSMMEESQKQLLQSRCTPVNITLNRWSIVEFYRVLQAYKERCLVNSYATDGVNIRGVSQSYLRYITPEVVDLAKHSGGVLDNHMLREYTQHTEFYKAIMQVKFIHSSIGQFIRGRYFSMRSIDKRHREFQCQGYRMDTPGGTALERLIEGYDYDPVELIRYIDAMCGQLRDRPNYALSLLAEYADIAYIVSKDFDRYPTNIPQARDHMIQEYKHIMAEKYSEMYIRKRISTMVTTIDGWQFIYPETYAGLEVEATRAHTWISSTLKDSVLQPKSHFIFMKKINGREIDTIVLRIKGRMIIDQITADGMRLSDIERNAISKYAEYLRTIDELATRDDLSDMHPDARHQYAHAPHRAIPVTYSF